MNRSVSAFITSVELSFLFTLISGHSRLNLSMIKKQRERKKLTMLQHTLPYPYSNDDKFPDTDSFYRRHLDLIMGLTVIANDNDQDIEIDYDEDSKSMQD